MKDVYMALMYMSFRPLIDVCFLCGIKLSIHEEMYWNYKLISAEGATKLIWKKQSLSAWNNDYNNNNTAAFHIDLDKNIITEDTRL